MLYTKIQAKSFLGSEGEDFYVFHLVQLRGTIATNWQYPFDRWSNVKSGVKCSNCFREEDI